MIGMLIFFGVIFAFICFLWLGDVVAERVDRFFEPDLTPFDQDA